MGTEYGVVINIRTKADVAAAAEAQAAVQGLAGATNESTKGSEKFTGAQKVSTREIKILTAELLRSVGVHGEAAAAGRVAASSFEALGSSAKVANLALAASGLAVVTLIPTIYEWVAGSKEASKENEELTRQIVDQLPHLDQYVKVMGDAAGAAQRQLEATRKLVVMQQQDRVAAIDKEIAGLNEVIPKTEIWTKRRLSHSEALQQMNILEKQSTEAVSSEDKKVEEARAKIAALAAERVRLNEAIASGLSLGELEDKRSEGAKNAAAEAERAAKQDLADRKRFVDTKRWLDEQLALDEAKQTDEERKEWGKKVDAQAKANAKRLMDEEIYNREMAKLEQERFTAMVKGIGESLGYLGQAFGKNKAIRAAAAAVDTYAAADSALAEVHPTIPAGVIAAAAVVAKGLAQVANIEKIGFDDPASDAMAREFGRKWARDMVHEAHGGFQEQLRASSDVVRSVHTHIDRGITVQNLNAGAYFDSGQTDSLKRLSRALNVIGRLEERATVKQ